MLLTPILREIASLSLPQANMMVVLHVLSQAANSPDATGVNDALFAIARLMAGFVGGAVALVLVAEGYHYMFTDSASRGVHLKRFLATVIGGAILVVLGVAIAPYVVSAILPGK